MVSEVLMAVYQISLLPTFTFKSEEWESWFRRFRQATGLVSKSEEIQINTLIYSMGDKAEDILQSLRYQTRKQKVLCRDREMQRLYFTKRCNIIYDRAKFNSRMQQDGELVEKSIHKVHAQAQHCSYGELHNQMVSDLIVIGIHNTSLSQKLQMGSRFDFRKSNQYGS